MFHTSDAVVEVVVEEVVEEEVEDLVPTAVDGRARLRREERPFEVSKDEDDVTTAPLECDVRESESVVFARVETAVLVLFLFKRRAARTLSPRPPQSDGLVFFGGVKPLLIRGCGLFEVASGAKLRHERERPFESLLVVDSTLWSSISFEKLSNVYLYRIYVVRPKGPKCEIM